MRAGGDRAALMTKVGVYRGVTLWTTAVVAVEAAESRSIQEVGRHDVMRWMTEEGMAGLLALLLMSELWVSCAAGLLLGAQVHRRRRLLLLDVTTWDLCRDFRHGTAYMKSQGAAQKWAVGVS